MANDETVTTRIVLEAAMALKSLADLTNATNSFAKKIQLAQAQVRSSATQWGVSFQQAKATLQGLDASISGTAQSSTIFGGAGQEAWNKVGNAAEVAGTKTKTATSSMVGGINLVRLALHVLATSAIFAVIAGFTKLFSVAIEGLKKIEVSVYNLANAERALSQAGIEVTFKDLEAVVDRLYDKFGGLFSRLDLQDTVADIAIATKELGLTQEQVEKIAATAAALQLRRPEKTLAEAEGMVLTAILSGQTKGLRSLGVAANETSIEQKALALKLIETGEQANEQQKSVATLELAYDALAGDAENLAQYQNTLTGAQQQLAATWEDLLAELAQDFAPIAIQGLKILVYDLQVLQAIFQAISPYIQSAATNVAAFIAATKGLGGLNIFEKISKFTDQFKEAKGAYEDYFESFNDSLDTPTAEPEPIVIDTSAAEEELEDLLKDLEKLQDKIDETESDHKLKIARFDEDTRIDRGRAVEDYNQNVLQATRSFNQKRSESNRKYRQKESEEERKFQEDMRKLREEFLYSLEDALRERDARQVLRLVDKYNMDKESAERDNEIRRQTAAENHALDQAEEKKQLEERLRTMAEEQALKLQRMDQDSALKRARMEEDHALEMAELREQMDERLLEAATKMAEELGLNEEGAKAIYDLLNQYYGTDGSLAALTSQGYAAMLGNAQGFLAQLTGLVAQQQGLMAAAAASAQSYAGTLFAGAQAGFGAFPAGGAAGNPGSLGRPTSPRPRGVPRYATGGQFVATRATPFIAGEGSENELVTITPFSQMRSQNTASFSGSDLGGTSTINLGVTLSSELKAEIINKTLDKVALVIEHVRREK